MKTLFAGALLAVTSIAVPASAATYDLFADFGNAVFSYGSVNAAGQFSAFAQTDCSNVGITQSCYRGNDTYQLVAQRPGPSILVHPGPGATENSAVLFTAPTTGSYAFDFTAQRADNGDGVGLSVFLNGALLPIAQIDAANPSAGLAGRIALTAGQSVGFAIDRGPSNYFGDSTFVAGSIGAVPEPAAWAMMIGGFGLVGGTLRRRRAQVRTGVTFA